MSPEPIKIDMMHIAKPTNTALGMYMHEQNDLVEIPGGIDSKVLLRLVVWKKRKYLKARSSALNVGKWDIGKVATNVLSME
jgi:hypothetical protein